jgi:hypothetical protein
MVNQDHIELSLALEATIVLILLVWDCFMVISEILNCRESERRKRINSLVLLCH